MLRGCANAMHIFGFHWKVKVRLRISPEAFIKHKVFKTFKHKIGPFDWQLKRTNNQSNEMQIVT